MNESFSTITKTNETVFHANNNNDLIKIIYKNYFELGE